MVLASDRSDPDPGLRSGGRHPAKQAVRNRCSEQGAALARSLVDTPALDTEFRDGVIAHSIGANNWYATPRAELLTTLAIAEVSANRPELASALTQLYCARLNDAGLKRLARTKRIAPSFLSARKQIIEAKVRAWVAAAAAKVRAAP